jgi:hypothetical protein
MLSKPGETACQVEVKRFQYQSSERLSSRRRSTTPLGSSDGLASSAVPLSVTGETAACAGGYVTPDAGRELS